MTHPRRVTWVLAGAGLAVALAVPSTWPPLRGRFAIVHDSPIFQDITRAAFLTVSPTGGMAIHFSTLESYSRNREGNRFLLVSYEPGSGRVKLDTVAGAQEARSYGYAAGMGRYVLGTSLNPQVLLYDPERGTVETVFRGPRSNPFIHRLAVRGDDVYTILSTPGRPVPGFGGILRVDIRTGETQLIPFTETAPQGWGGVETVDPSGRVWFYRAYPFRRMWYDSVGGMRDRVLAGHGDWTVESWDTWDGTAYVMLTNTQGQFTKRPVDLEHPQGPAPVHVPVAHDLDLFLASVPLDLYHNGDPALAGLYFNPSTSAFYRRAPGRDVLTRLGHVELGQFQVMGFHRGPQEVAVRWQHPRWGELEVLGLSPSGELVLWLRGRKTYGLASLQTGRVVLHAIDLANMSPADITSLAVGRDGVLYGGGMLTMSHLFRVDPHGYSSRVLPGAIPNAEGQISLLFAGLDERLYGAGYPDAVPFRFDPAQPWGPGRQSDESNPLNLGPVGHRNQTRPRRGVQALDGTVWFQSASDYTFPIAYALAKADFAGGTLVVKTDLDDGLPIVRDLAVLDANHLVLLGSLGDRPGLFALDQSRFLVTRSVPLSRSGGALANLAPRAPGTALFLAQGRDLSRVHLDLSLEHLHRSVGDIVRIVAGEGREVILIGRAFIERLDPVAMTAQVWWRGAWWERFVRRRGSKPRGYLFRHLSWTPVVFVDGSLVFADEEKLWRFDPHRN